MHMMKKVEKQKLQRLICQNLRSLCEAGLPDSTNISIEGLIGITVNSEHVILVGIHEEIGDGEEEMIDSIKDASHGVTGGGKGAYMSSLQAKMFHQTHAVMLHEHMMQVMQAGMAAAQGIPSTDKSMQQFSKAGQQHDKNSYKYSPFNESDDEEHPSTTQAFTLTPSPNKSNSSSAAEGKDAFLFSNYDQTIFPGNRDKGPREETQASPSIDTTSKAMNKSLTQPEQVQGSTICITPVIDTPKEDESVVTTPKAQSPISQITPQMTNVPDYGRRLGTLTAVKQEGASRRRISKSHQQLGAADLRVEEISDGDNTMQGDKVMSVQDPMMGSNAAGSPGGGSHPLSPHGEESASGLNSNRIIIQHMIDEQQIPTEIPADAIMEIDSLSQMDTDDQRHDFVDLDNSLLQMLPDMTSERGHDGSIPEIVEIEDDDDDVKGEPKENIEGSPGSDLDQGPVSAARLQVLMELQKKIAAEIHTENKVAADGSESTITRPPQKAGEAVDDMEDYEGFLPPPIPPFMGRGFGHRGCGFKSRGGSGFGHRFFNRGGCGGRGAMFGGGGMFGRGGHMMGFGTPYFGEKKLWKCKLCAVSFNNKTNFESHMLKHENKGQCNAGLDESVGMSCPYCKKRFRYKSWLDQHITTHTKEKLFHCPYCSKAYTRGRNVRKHIQMFHPEVLMGQIIDTDTDSLTTVKQQDLEDGDS